VLGTPPAFVLSQDQTLHNRKAEMLIDLLARFCNLFYSRLLDCAYSLVVQFSKINDSCPTRSLSKAGRPIYHTEFLFATLNFELFFIVFLMFLVLSSAATFIRYHRAHILCKS
ncbi:hypothetical protein ASL11_18485, partial [Paenibacillus sp. Soil750]